jgi:uncharacterized coiled-coil protein SlyX
MIFNTTIRTVQGGGSGGGGSVIEGELFLTADGEEFLTADDEQFVVAFQDRLVDVDNFPIPPNEESVYKITRKVVNGIYRVTSSGEVRKHTQTNVRYSYFIVDDHTAVANPIASDDKTHTWYIDNTGIWYYVNGTWHDLVSEYEGETYRGLLYDNPYTATLSSASWYVYVSEVNVSYGISTTEAEVWRYVESETSSEWVSLDDDLAKKEDEITSLNTQLTEKDGEITSLNTQLTEKDSEITSLNTQLERLEDHVDVANASVEPGGYIYYKRGTNNQYACGGIRPGYTVTELSLSTSCVVIAGYAFYSKQSLTTAIIPDSVTTIGKDAFSACRSLTLVEMGNGVTSIGNSAFASCTALTSIVIPDNVISIGYFAFGNCSGLINIELGNGVTSIGRQAFKNCSGLTSIVIPNSVTSIGEELFSGCSGLESIIVGEKNTIYHSDGNCVIKTASKTLITGCKNSVIPADGSVTSIGAHAFDDCSGLTSVAIPDSVTSIGSYAFNSCSSLTSVVIGDGVTSIGVRAFAYCSSLTDITYNGTQAQWNAITKGTNWNTNTGNYTIHCTDGDIAKS